MESTDIHVAFQNVQKSYDGRTLVVKDLNVDIPRGEFLTLLGPSGSGKTTTLMMLAGFETATHGDILLNGSPINNVPPNKRGIGMVFQNYALFPHMTVAENLAFPLQVRGLSKSDIESKINRALDMVSMPDFASRKPGQLSGGQQQRVALARALVFDPELVLMDEPLGALDKQLREQMQYEIKHIHENLGVTVVYVTHDQSEALTMSNRIAVFNDGIIQQMAEPDSLYERPDNAFVAGFIGENNRLEGVVDSIDNNICDVTLATGEKVKALAVNVNGPGDKTLLSLRPERVLINPSETTALDTKLQARVEELIYLGDHIRTRLSVAGRDDFVVKISNRETQRFPDPGETVSLGWHSQDCRALDFPAAA